MGDASEQKARQYYDDFSDSYERGRGYGYHQMIDDLEVQVTAPYARDARVLELGCGTGLILARIAEVAKEAVGIDLSEGMAQRAKERGLEVHIGSVCPFEDEEFDLTYSFKVLAHVPDIDAAIREATRVTRPGGHLLLEFYNPWSLRYLAKKVAGSQPIGDDRTEADISTRWDSPRDIPGLLPPNLELVDYYGVRVLTPFAAVHRIPGVARGLSRAEQLASRSPLRYFGGFLIAVLRKS
ncbi:MAG: class I SAM-dependent methyltransferase [Deltaproteobacteria bacterium]|nr:class I SAM-dependent methyltransferase [Deltaproteobacteria bacterium]